MKLRSALLSVCFLLLHSTIVQAFPIEQRQANPTFAGYLIATFSDANPSVQFYLSNGNDPASFSYSNKGQPILVSTIGTKAVRDVYLTTNGDRSKWWVIATDLDIRAEGFTWDQATRNGSRNFVVWSSENLVDWSEPSLVQAEDETAGMVWAPSAVWDESSSQFFVFWASRFYDPTDTEHTGAASIDRIRCATTTDFQSFRNQANYIAEDGKPVIDQEFQYLGQPGHYARFVKDENVNHVYQELTTTGIFGQWTRVDGYVTSASQFEGPASFADNLEQGKYHLLLDNYTEYVPFETSNIGGASWTTSSYPSFPSGLKHGSVTPLTQAEYDAWQARYPA